MSAADKARALAEARRRIAEWKAMTERERATVHLATIWDEVMSGRCAATGDKLSPEQIEYRIRFEATYWDYIIKSELAAGR